MSPPRYSLTFQPCPRGANHQETESWITCLTAIESTASWRAMVASEHPDDKGNEDAITGLQRLAETAPNVSTEWAEAYAALWDNDCDAHIGHRAVELEQEMLRRVGFSGHWDTAEEFVTELVRAAARPTHADAA